MDSGKIRALLASATTRHKTTTTKTQNTVFVANIIKDASEEEQVGSWERSQNISIASVKITCQIKTVNKHLTAAETFAHLL